MPTPQARLRRRAVWKTSFYHFKVSSLVSLRRLLDADLLPPASFQRLYQTELAHLQKQERSATEGGDFYRTLTLRTGRRFAEAVVTSTLEGYTLLRDALRMLGIRKVGTFNKLAERLLHHLS
ncbi:MAG: hypothetical protein NZZ60_01405 [Bacteroidia bacterium]|nr:hypothetical protein [Bacteroidia bacterium]MDW8236718.1 hypothetical protein [Bacteroidia bacterium]